MKGILFKEDLFRAVVAGTKTETRRIFKLNHPVRAMKSIDSVEPMPMDDLFNTSVTVVRGSDDKLCEHLYTVKPRYQVGDIVYMKEPFYFHPVTKDVCYKYLANKLLVNVGYLYPFKNKLFMPEKYARHFIKITGVSVERLQDITEDAAKAEGVTSPVPSAIGSHFYRFGFHVKWIEINGVKSWDDNPFVFVYEFELVIK